MKKRLSVQISLMAALFLVLGMEAWAQCGCRAACNHYNQYNNQFQVRRGLENHPQYAVSARSTANRYNNSNVQVRYVEPVIVNPGYGYPYGYGYNPYGSNYGYGYNNYGYSNYYNRGNCGQRGYYRGW